VGAVTVVVAAAADTAGGYIAAAGLEPTLPPLATGSRVLVGGGGSAGG